MAFGSRFSSSGPSSAPPASRYPAPLLPEGASVKVEDHLQALGVGFARRLESEIQVKRLRTKMTWYWRLGRAAMWAFLALTLFNAWPVSNWTHQWPTLVATALAALTSYHLAEIGQRSLTLLERLNELHPLWDSWDALCKSSNAVLDYHTRAQGRPRALRVFDLAMANAIYLKHEGPVAL